MVTRVQVLAPPEERLTAWEWVRRNLFDGWWNGLLTFVTAGAIVFFASVIGRWVMQTRWDVITANLRFWLVGLMPVEQVFRAYWAGGLVVLAVLLTAAGLRLRVRIWPLVGLWVGTIIAVALVMSPIQLDHIGGLYLTLLLAVIAISASFPIGVLVGMGRVSRLPAIRTFSILYIELIRGVPLITVLLWFFIFFTLLSGDAITRVQRAMIGLTIFTSAYVGEIVRAGIQSVPRGQTEAARAVGLSALQTMRFIVLPQAVKNMIPALVGQFITLFKDTSLTVIVGLSELVGAGRSLLAITDYLHDTRQVYVFLVVVYFLFSYTMSYGSRILEKRLGLGER